MPRPRIPLTFSRYPSPWAIELSGISRPESVFARCC